MNAKLVTLSVTSSLALFSGCGLIQSLIPPVEVANAFGMDNVEVEATLETDADPATSSIKALAVSASYTAKGSFDDFAAPDNPVPISLSFAPQFRSMTFKLCKPAKDSFKLRFSKLSVRVADGVGTPSERSYQTPDYPPIAFTFTKTAQGSYEPDFSGLVIEGQIIAINWTSIRKIVNVAGANTPNNGFLTFKVTSSDDALKNCAMTLKFGPGKGTLKF